MANLRPLVSNFTSLLLLLFHLGCFIFTSHHHHHHQHHRHKSKKRKLSPLSLHSSPSLSRPKLKAHKAFSSSWSFLKRIFSCTSTTPITIGSSKQSSSVSVIGPDSLISDPPLKRSIEYRPESDISADYHFFPLRNDIYPCPACGEIFQKPNLLEQHQSIKHAVSELIGDDSGKNIVQIIFMTGWPDKAKNQFNFYPKIHRILKIHNGPKILTRFEEYRESVKSKAARNGAVRRRDERCVADGNELLRFHCTTFLCDLGQNGNTSICNHQYCSVCGIIRSGFSPKMDGISTLSTSWRAHVAIPNEIEEEFKFMHVKRAMLVCRVIAGRIGCDPDVGDKDDPGYDSVSGKDGGACTSMLDEEHELSVFNPRAVLPCFVIVYTV